MHRDELKELANISKSITRAKERYAELAAVMSSPSFDRTGGRGGLSRPTENQGNALMRQNDFIKRLEADRSELVAALLPILDSMPPMKRTVMKLRYIDGEKYEDIADLMGYELSSVYKAHHKAIQEFFEE